MSLLSVLLGLHLMISSITYLCSLLCLLFLCSSSVSLSSASLAESSSVDPVALSSVDPVVQSSMPFSSSSLSSLFSLSSLSSTSVSCSTPTASNPPALCPPSICNRVSMCLGEAHAESLAASRAHREKLASARLSCLQDGPSGLASSSVESSHHVFGNDHVNLVCLESVFLLIQSDRPWNLSSPSYDLNILPFMYSEVWKCPDFEVWEATVVKELNTLQSMGMYKLCRLPA